MANVAQERPVRGCCVTEDVLQRIGWRTHVEVGPQEPGAVLVVVLEGVASHPLALEDALPILRVASEREAGHAIAFRGDWLFLAIEAEDEVVDALVVDHIDDWPAAADEQQRVVDRKIL